MVGQEERRNGSKGRGRGPAFFLAMGAVFVGVILFAPHMLHQIGNALP